jgi:hypothetical protein
MTTLVTIFLILAAWCFLGAALWLPWYGNTERTTRFTEALSVFLAGPIIWFIYLHILWKGGDL